MGREIHDLIADAGLGGPLLFLVAQATITMLFLPRSPGVVIAGAAFGTVGGTALAWLALMIGATACFYVGRLGRRPGNRLATWRSEGRGARLGPWVKRLDAWSERRGPLALLYIRLVPGAPFTSVNYAAGMTSLPALHFLIATGAGIVPYTVALAALGGSLTQLRSDRLAGILGAVVALAIAAPIIDRALRRRRPARRT